MYVRTLELMKKNGVTEESLLGRLANSIKPEQKSQFGLHDDADPNSYCYDFILNEEETTKQVDSLSS